MPALLKLLRERNLLPSVVEYDTFKSQNAVELLVHNLLHETFGQQHEEAKMPRGRPKGENTALAEARGEIERLREQVHHLDRVLHDRNKQLDEHERRLAEVRRSRAHCLVLLSELIKETIVK